MGAGHQGQAVGVVEGFRDVLSKSVASASGRDAPPTAVIGVRPQQVAHGALREGGLINTNVCSRGRRREALVPRVGPPAGGPELLCGPGCLWRETDPRGDRRSEKQAKHSLQDLLLLQPEAPGAAALTCPSTSAVSGR